MVLPIMPTKEEVLLMNDYENQILGLVDYQDEYARSVLQGAAGAIVWNILRKGKELGKADK